MALAKIRAWVRLVVTIGVAVVVLLVIFKNWNKSAELWLFHEFPEVPVLWLIVVTAVASIIGWKIIVGIRGAFAQVRGTKASASENKVTDQSHS